MIYTQDLLDRSTGQLRTVSIGNWVTVTELGEHYGVGNRKVRAILHHMGLLHREGRSYRLPWSAVEKGLGKRHDKPKSGYPFDVISPLGQQLVAQVWDATVEDYEAELRSDSQIDEARAALNAFKQTRIGGSLKAQQEVCWLRDHFPSMTYEAIAKTLEISPTLVRRYADKQTADRMFRRGQKVQLQSLEPVFASVQSPGSSQAAKPTMRRPTSHLDASFLWPQEQTQNSGV